MTASYTRDAATGVWRRPEHADWSYSDGEATEYRLLRVVLGSRDRSIGSDELRRQIVDWPSAYHLSAARANLLRPLSIEPGTRVLELGSGCGGLTRYLGETGATVCAVEGSPLRARIGAARCRDQENVRVYCDDFANFQSDTDYDVVTLIGVLEYAPLFFRDPEPVDACLRSALRFLSPGGRLVVAIENQLGLKYLAGTREDHVGRSHFGVNDLYDEGTPVTFGRRELTARLARAGLQSNDVLLPFPDYKLPSVVVSEAGLAHPALRLGDLLARSLVHGYNDPNVVGLHQPLAWRVVARNGLVADIANSFLVVSRRERERPPSHSDTFLAKGYAASRRRRYMTETSFLADDASIRVAKQPLYEDEATGGDERPTRGRFVLRCAETPYVEGELLVFGLWRLVARGSTTAEIADWAKPWIDALSARILSNGGIEPMLPGDAIDCTPFNAVRTRSGSLEFIADEWASTEPVPLLWVVLRGIVFSFHGYPVHEALAPLTYRALLRDLLSRLELPCDDAAIDLAWRWESAFQTHVTDRSQWLDLDGLLDMPLGAASPELREVQRALDAPVAPPGTDVTALLSRGLQRVRRGQRVASQSLRLAAASTRVAARVVEERTLGAQISRLVATWRQSGVRGLEGIARDLLTLEGRYTAWIKAYDTLSVEDRRAMAAHIDILDYRPRISVVMPVFDTPEGLLRRAVASVREQLYPDWELCIADDASTASWVRPCIEDLAAQDPRIKTTFRDVNGHISAASNSALALATGEFVALLDHDDELPAHALYAVVTALNENPGLDVIYSDEDKIDETGTRSDPYFKPDWNPELFLGQNLVSHLGVYRRSLVEAVGGFRQGYEGSQDWDLALRIVELTTAERIHHIPRVLYHWRTAAGSTSTGHDQKSYVVSASARLLEDHLDRKAVLADVLEAGGSHFRIRRRLRDPAPSVSVVIITDDRQDRLRQCIESVRERTSYPNYSIVVIGNPTDEEPTRDYLSSLPDEPHIRFVAAHPTDNHSAIVNLAVEQTDSEFVCLLHNDIEATDAEWLGEMVSHALCDGVGAVGALLYYSNDTIRHAGITLGLGGVAGSLYEHNRRGERGYFSRACLIQSLSALTAACMVLRKQVFTDLGGFDEVNLPGRFNDVDFCLRLRERGYRTVWTPFAALYEHGSAARDENTLDRHARSAREVAYMRERWGEWLDNDPAHNPNLALSHGWPRLAFPPRRSPRL